MGQTSNVSYPFATFVDGPTGRITIYYGAADTYTAVAFTTVSQVFGKNLYSCSS